MSGERVIEHLIGSPDPVKTLLQNYDNRIVWLERDTRQLASGVSMVGVPTFANLPPVDSVANGATAWIIDVAQKWTVIAGVWTFTGNTP